MRDQSQRLKMELALPLFRARLRAEVLSLFGVIGCRVVHRRRGACHAIAAGGQPVLSPRCSVPVLALAIGRRQVLKR